MVSYKDHKAIKKGFMQTFEILLDGRGYKNLYDIHVKTIDKDGYIRADKCFTLIETSDYFKALEIFDKIVSENSMEVIY